MSLTETVLEGTLKSDGTLELDQKPNLPAGRVTVALRRDAEVILPTGDPFWQRMQAIWAIPTSGRNPSDSGANTLEEVRRAREEWDEHQDELERLQDECRTARQLAERRGG